MVINQITNLTFKHYWHRLGGLLYAVERDKVTVVATSVFVLVVAVDVACVSGDCIGVHQYWHCSMCVGA